MTACLDVGSERADGGEMTQEDHGHDHNRVDGDRVGSSVRLYRQQPGGCIAHRMARQ